jgi:hypothetical protein
MNIITLPDFTGDNQTHAISDLITAAGLSAPTTALMLVIREISGGASSSRVGGPNATANRGIPLNAADTLVLPAAGVGPTPASITWDLTATYIYAASGDTLAIAYVIW